MRKGLLYVVAIAASTIILYSIFTNITNAAQFTENNEQKVMGLDASSGIRFSSAENIAGVVIVNVTLKNNKQIIVIIDKINRRASAKTVLVSDQTNSRITTLSSTDLFELKKLGSSMDRLSGNVGDAIIRTFNLLSEMPPGTSLNFDSSARNNAANPESILSLCHATSATGSYKINNKVYKETAGIGCYKSANKCLGRCGAGCGGGLKGGDPTIQQITQDCLNHDLCTRKAGTILGQCKEEFNAAIDDYLLGTDCASLSGTWNDVYSFIWQLAQKSHAVSGSTKTVACSTWNVKGDHSSSKVSLTATHPPAASCCSSFTYSGTMSSCDVIKGSWTNVCGLNGSFTMLRKGTSSSQVKQGVGSLHQPTDLGQ